jgi:ligand-binding sensor domain-containing protein
LLINNYQINDMFFDRSTNTMWFATVHGILKYQNETFTLINAVNHPQLSYYTYISCMTQDPQGDMWFGTAYGHMVKYDGSVYTLDSVGTGQGNETIMAIAFDSNTMYIADNLCGFWVRENGSQVVYSVENSDMTSDYLTGLYVDPNHNVWISAMDYGNTDAFGIDIYNKNQVALSVPEVSKQLPYTVYPNPTRDLITISSALIKDGDAVKLTDITGRSEGYFIVTNNSIDISRLAGGVYLMSTADMKIQAAKVVKE